MSSADPGARETGTAIETRDLACGYDGKTVLSGVSIRLPRSRVTCILGKSGCGKSTLLRNLLLLEAPMAGTIAFDGEEVRFGDREVLDRLRRSLGVLFQSAALFNSMTLLENSAFPILECTRAPEAVANDIALRNLDLVGLANYAHYLPASVSGGMRKRCGIARALALDPRYLFLDEPSAGLDPVTAAGIDRLILDLRDQLGTTFIVVTHEISSIKAIADHIVMIDEGRVVLSDAAARVLASDLPVARDFFERRLPDSAGAAGAPGLASILLPKNGHAG